MADLMLVCKGCGEKFEFSEGEQQFFREKEFTTPKRCPECRRKNRQARKAEARVMSERG